jgi:hypothetical protein
MLRLTLHIARAPGEVAPRACDCGFCTRHGAAWVSDAAGRLEIAVGDPALARHYRQGSNTARFLFCGGCGVLVAVLLDDDRCYAAVNARCLDEAAALAQPITVSPQRLAAEEKVARWRQLWTADVRWNLPS